MTTICKTPREVKELAQAGCVCGGTVDNIRIDMHYNLGITNSKATCLLCLNVLAKWDANAPTEENKA